MDTICRQVRQTFLEPVEWQVAEIRDAFHRIIARKSFICNYNDGEDQGEDSLEDDAASLHLGLAVREKTLSGGGGDAGIIPRPSVFAEIVQGSIGLTTGGDRGSADGRKDFDFRTAFAVHEDRDLMACPILREVWSTKRINMSMAASCSGTRLDEWRVFYAQQLNCQAHTAVRGVYIDVCHPRYHPQCDWKPGIAPAEHVQHAIPVKGKQCVSFCYPPFLGCPSLSLSHDHTPAPPLQTEGVLDCSPDRIDPGRTAASSSLHHWDKSLARTGLRGPVD